MFALPGGVTRGCAKHDVLADGTEFVGVGIAPEVTVRPTVDGGRAGRDEVLEAALRALSAQGAAAGPGTRDRESGARSR